MLKRRLTRAPVSIGLAGGLLVGAAGAAAIPGPTQLAHIASAIALDEGSRYYVKIDNTGDGYEDVAYRWQ